jgi:hypothetical protein
VFQTEFATYLLPFKRRLPVPVLDRIYQDIADARYTLGNSGVAGKRRKGKSADDGTADTGAPRGKQRNVAVNDDDDNDAPPTPPRPKPNS